MIKKIALLCCLATLCACQTTASRVQALYTDSELNYTLADRHKLNKIIFNNTVRSLNDKDYGYTIVEDPTGTAPFPIVERFEVRPGDCGESWDWSDCKNDRERSELKEPGAANKEGQTFWYGWSLYLPMGYPNVYPTKTCLGQFHHRATHPAWMFQNYDGGLWLNKQMGHETNYKLIPEKELRGKWHKIVVHAHWSRKSDGFFKVWVNDELKVDYEGKTMIKPIVYFKYGVYRSFISRSRGIVPTQIAYYANVKKVVEEDVELLKP